MKLRLNERIEVIDMSVAEEVEQIVLAISTECVVTFLDHKDGHTRLVLKQVNVPK